jgi:hypothetical protein
MLTETEAREIALASTGGVLTEFHRVDGVVEALLVDRDARTPGFEGDRLWRVVLSGSFGGQDGDLDRVTVWIDARTGHLIATTGQGG